MSNFVMIGDIHGQAGKLEQLLNRLGFAEVAGTYAPARGIARQGDTRLVFLGDFIDRGPDNRRVIEIVRRMMAEGHAQAVMGNHEFNAICYHTLHPDTGVPLRPHSTKNQVQHASFLAEYPLGGETTRDIIDWFMALPLFLELDTQSDPLTGDPNTTAPEHDGEGLRVVHACWDQGDIDYLTERLGEPAVMDRCFLLEATCEGTRAFAAVETLLKGPEIPLPAGSSFLDKDGYKRTHIRYKWWSRGQTYREVAMVSREQLPTIPDLPLAGSNYPRPYPIEAPPIFFGHYWLNGKPRLQSRNAACLDYSAGKKGALVAYHWHNDDPHHNLCGLADDRFITAD
ncbi:MAG: metallophosphoesterase [Chromatiales bacterium]